MDQQKREANNAKRREAYALLTTEEKAEIAKKQKERRAAATAQQKADKRLKDNAQKAVKRANSSGIERLKRIRLEENSPFKIAVNIDFSQTPVSTYNCGDLDKICGFCGAKHFEGERNKTKKTFGKCCRHGAITEWKQTPLNDTHVNEVSTQIGIKPPLPIPIVIDQLLNKTTSDSKNFMENILSYNNLLAFASFGCKLAKFNSGPYCFRLHGQIYHRSGPMYPNDNDTAQYAQLYFFDSNVANEIRMEHPANKGCKLHIVQKLDQFIRANNKLADCYKMLKQVEEEEIKKGNNTKNIIMSIAKDKSLDQRRYNTACSNDIAVVFNDNDGEPPFNRDIRVYLRSANKTVNISILHELLDAMTYPIFFPYGESQWHTKITKATCNKRDRITQMEYYSYRLQIRHDLNVLLNGGKLSLQYICDSYCRMEANRLKYLRDHQKELKCDSYTNLKDYLSIRAANHNAQVGRTIILPSTFTGSPRNMLQHYQDAMSIVRKHGPPSLFITMTCSPKWTEITKNLYPNQTWNDRPDLVSRLFYLKSKELIHDIEFKQIFGEVAGLVYVIEFQKRGLPHMHILVILKSDKFNTPEQIDEIVSSQIPDFKKNPQLYKIVTTHMMHGPCGLSFPASPCMENSFCKKKFPKANCDETKLDNGFPLYKRPDDKTKEFKKKIKNDKAKSEYVFGNKDVVPYCPYLSQKYDCHINVEACASVSAVKYIYKYVYKGHDAADIKLSSDNILNHDEISDHVNSRYVSAPEAMWRIFGYDMQYQSHTIIRLQVHLPYEQNVTFQKGEEQQAFENALLKNTSLTSFFLLNQEIKDQGGIPHLYIDTPNYYTLDRTSKKWKLRQGNKFAEKVIGRMYTVNPLDQEKYALRHLLLNVKGATSFEQLRTVDGVTCETFKEACIKLGIFEDDLEWDLALQDAVEEKMPSQIIKLFALILSHGPPQNPLALWNKYKDSMMERYVMEGIPNAQDKVLREIQDILTLSGKYLAKDFNLPEPLIFECSSIFDSYDLKTEFETFKDLQKTLNTQQRNFVDDIINCLNRTDSGKKCFMIDGPAGSGKTFIYKTLISYVRGSLFESKQGIALPVASTGIAATLLVGGRTSHSQFGIPMNVNDDETNSRFVCGKNPDWERLKMCNLIIWDECTMTSRYILDLVDRLLREITNCDAPFGGKVFILGGDFRQCLPITKHGSKSKIIESTIKNSKVWKHIKKYTLEANMRVGGDSEFAQWLTDLGEGKFNSTVNRVENAVEIPSDYLANGTLVHEIFGGITCASISNYANRAILCPLNEDAFLINEKVLNLLDGEYVEYKSADSITREELNEEDNFPVEYLNTLTPSGMPPHILKLKEGAIVMLLRNINTKLGLCNGTRVIIETLKKNLIIGKVLTGRSKDNQVYIPRITTTSSDTDFPFELRRRQFPIRVAFGMTINKSQGQSLDKVGLHLSKPVFSHGQLYVAFSRATAKRNVKVHIESGAEQGNLLEGQDVIHTVNCVFQEVLQQI